MPHVPRQREDRRARHATPLPQAAATAMTAGPRVAIRNTQDEIARRRAERRDRVVPLSGRAGVASRSAHAQLSGRADFRRGSAARCRAGTGTSGQHRSGTRWPARRPAGRPRSTRRHASRSRPAHGRRRRPRHRTDLLRRDWVRLRGAHRDASASRASARCSAESAFRTFLRSSLRRAHHSGGLEEVLSAAALSPDGGSIYPTGSDCPVCGGEEPNEAFTFGAKVATGAEIWRKVVTTDSPNQDGRSVAVNPDGGTVYVVIEDFTDVAHDFTTAPSGPDASWGHRRRPRRLTLVAREADPAPLILG